ncbi:MAG: cyclodeaminase/cyclohydrolase family protein [Egibacteraceae bacterium]
MTAYLEHTLAEFLDEVAADRPTPGAGSAAAVVVALATGLLAMAGQQSDDASAEVAARIEELRRLVAPLAQADADAYARVIEVTRRPDDDPGRADALRQALSGACEVPLAVARYAAEVAALAANLAQGANPRPRSEVIAAAALAETAGRIAAMLVRLNLSGLQDPRIAQVARLAGQARRDASRVTYTS